MKEPEIINVRSLLQNQDVIIPDYQRPYKWTDKNVNQLIDDIIANTNKTSYRIGTSVIHADDNGKFNIVDGQQRTITFVLIAYALKNEGRLKKVENREVKECDLIPKFELKFINEISKKNIRDNYRAIIRRISEFDDRTIWFFYEKCQMVQIILQDITEAFQFFDSQNARGKDLEPHELPARGKWRFQGKRHQAGLLPIAARWRHQYVRFHSGFRQRIFSEANPDFGRKDV
ncbi:MAG: DUF262 domain-containing protein [Bacteroidales bacterium]|nr:DUF262 domain-containing protein [Bacteroidales bacterium]